VNIVLLIEDRGWIEES